MMPRGFAATRELAGFDEMENLWQLHDQVVCPVDSVKSMEARRGWSHERLARYNRERFQDLVSAGWDLIIIDEAHRLGGTSEQVARYQLGEALDFVGDVETALALEHRHLTLRANSDVAV